MGAIPAGRPAPPPPYPTAAPPPLLGGQGGASSAVPYSDHTDRRAKPCVLPHGLVHAEPLLEHALVLSLRTPLHRQCIRSDSTRHCGAKTAHKPAAACHSRRRRRPQPRRPGRAAGLGHRQRRGTARRPPAAADALPRRPRHRAAPSQRRGVGSSSFMSSSSLLLLPAPPPARRHRRVAAVRSARRVGGHRGRGPPLWPPQPAVQPAARQPSQLRSFAQTARQDYRYHAQASQPDNS